MEKANAIKTAISSVAGAIGGLISYLIGGFDTALQALIIFMAIDYVMGLIVAGVFKKSGKSKNGALESRAGWKGLCRKGVTLLIVIVATYLDRLTGTDFIRDAVIIGFVANEALSILENAGLIGLPISKTLTNAVDVLKNKGDDNSEQ